jgi:hypothetical protein
MVALGDVRGLQIAEKKKAQAVEKHLNPPLQGPPEVKNTRIPNLPGGVITYNPGGGNHVLRPVYQVDPRIGEMRLDIQAIEQRINEAFYVNLFMAISAQRGIQPKNQLELAQVDAERLVQLGPVLQQLHSEFLIPFIARTFAQLTRRGMIPDPPLSLQNQPFRVKLVSTLALAQRAAESTAIERFAGFVGNIAGVFPEARDKVNVNEMVDQYAQLNGVIPSVVRDNLEAQAIQQQRAQAAAQAAQQEAVLAGVDAAQKTAETGQTLTNIDQEATFG